MLIVRKSEGVSWWTNSSVFLESSEFGLLREGRVAARNIEAAILGRPLAPFVYSTQGQLATIGRRTGVAKVLGPKFSGFLAWWLWRTVYLLKLPRLAKKLRVMFGWTLDLFFGREVEQMITFRDVVVLARKVFTHNGKPNPVHLFDAGSACENLALQAASMGLAAHGMAGFSFANARSLLHVPEHFDVAAMIALGRPGNPAELPAELREREVLNTRRPVAESICEGG